ncbi:CNT_collapsed_G0015930.mRNA.1.CDS.1 [Saccharomyces cerevisiae]|nr:CNT_collapsed_G0015930.mRNA.1.CDS.1 [Saccharomyces cerevisiae]
MVRQEEFLADLKIPGAKQVERRDIGLIKIFNEFEDIPLASLVLGIRGKRERNSKIICFRI